MMTATTAQGTQGSRGKQLVLAAMVFAVAMIFIDQTIVAIAIPKIESELSLSGAGGQWVVNGYLLALSALFAFGGRLADVLGRRLVVIIGVVGFAVTSALCGFTPTGAVAEAWIVGFRVGQGVFGALLFPAAVGIVVASFPLGERGKAMATFFGITGAMTAIGPIAGGYLTAWTWRAIFWINVPVAIIALILIVISKPDNERHRARLDYRGALLISAAMGLIVLGLQQSSVWGWNSPATWGCLAAGAVAAAVFVGWELRASAPLLQLRIFADRGFTMDTVLLTTMSVVFVPFFFFASLYSQAALGTSAADTGLYLMYFFLGFAIAAQVGGRMLDRRGAWLPVVAGAAIAAVGFYLLAGKLTDLSLGAQWGYIAIAGAGLGLMLGPASTDAVNRAPRSSYSEVTGITQTGRNFGASLGMAVLGTILLLQNKANVAATLIQHGVPPADAHRVAGSLSASGGSAGAGRADPALVHDVQVAFAHSTQTVFYVMAGVMAATFVLAVIGLPRRAMQVNEPTSSLEAGEACLPQP